MKLLLDNHFDRKKYVLIYQKILENYKKTKKVSRIPVLKSITQKAGSNKVSSNEIIFVSNKNINSLKDFIFLIESINLTKYIGDAPGNILTPPAFMEIAKKMSSLYNYNCKVFGDSELKKMRMNALLSVSAGSKYGGYLVKLQTKNFNKSQKPIVLVGKGITFDSGGNSIKTPEHMVNMKTDMLGASAILSVFNYLGKINFKKNIIGLLCIAENMPGRFGSRPDDIVKSYSGLNVEIVDTDAEGRLVMADGISYAHTFNPKSIINIAGLTGQQENISGGLFASIMGNNRKLNNKLIDSGDKVDERLVEFPLYEEYIDQTKSVIANVKNYNYDYKHDTIYAGAFLSNFVKEGQEWAHIDIAGPESKNELTRGFGIRLLSKFITN